MSCQVCESEPCTCHSEAQPTYRSTHRAIPYGLSLEEFGPALYAAVARYAQREQVRKQLHWISRRPELSHDRRVFHKERLQAEETRLTKEIVALSESLTPEQNSRLIRRYEQQEAVTL